MENKLISVETSNGIQQLKLEEYARWLCLIEAIDLVCRKAGELKTDMNGDDFWIKPLAFQKYIEQRMETMVLDVNREEFNIDIKESLKTKQYVEVEEVVEEVDEEPTLETLVEVVD